ncbi:MAG TPA: CARDB domain-containing protein [Solirubrobacterales bacterium]|nr:CARDB domain-containing protein [Solirubrobacterales bacterium]
MLRRGLALGGGLIVLILIVLGVKGCLDARANRELSDYARNVSQIVDETEQTSKAFFGKLEDPGDLTVTDFVNEVNADRSAMDNYASRIDGLGAPGDMGSAQSKLELVYELRAAAMGEIADKMSTALGDAGAEKATAAIANQMQKLFASDVVYEDVVRPEIDGVLADNGITDSDVPKSSFIPDDDTSWLEESTVADALGALGGGGGGTAGPGSHGLGLVGVSVNGTELVEGGESSVIVEEAAEVEVQIQNQGESTENGVSVAVSVDGANELEGDISAISAGEISTVTIPLTPTPSGTVALEIKVDTVPGEQISENNEATYTVTFE